MTDRGTIIEETFDRWSKKKEGASRCARFAATSALRITNVFALSWIRKTTFPRWRTIRIRRRFRRFFSNLSSVVARLKHPHFLLFRRFTFIALEPTNRVRSMVIDRNAKTIAKVNIRSTLENLNARGISFSVCVGTWCEIQKEYTDKICSASTLVVNM